MEDKHESGYMQEEKLKYFRNKLIALKEELLQKDEEIKLSLKNYSNKEEINDILMSTQKREKMLKEINAALERCTDGTFGYCEETGEEIGYNRLEIQPTARYCIEAQEKLEKQRRFRDEEEDE